MPQYKTHTAINLFCALPLLVGAGYYFLNPQYPLLFIFTGAFVYTTLFMSPDMDLARKIKWYSLRGLLSLPFRSYSKVFRHRGISHSLVFGSLSRIVWLALFVMLILYLCTGLHLSLDQIIAYYHLHQRELLYGFTGICSADIVHILTDKLSS